MFVGGPSWGRPPAMGVSVGAIMREYGSGEL